MWQFLGSLTWRIIDKITDQTWEDKIEARNLDDILQMQADAWRTRSNGGTKDGNDFMDR